MIKRTFADSSGDLPDQCGDDPACLPGFALCLAFVPKFQDDRVLFLVCGISLLFNLVGMEWLYKALEQYQYITFRSIAFKALSVVLMFAMIRSQEDYLQYGFLTIFASVGSNIFNFFHARRYITFVPSARTI